MHIPIRRTRKEINQALKRYAQKRNIYVRTVRNSTMIYRAAMLEDEVARKAVSLTYARKAFTEMYPDTGRLGPLHVNNWIA